MIGCIEAFIRKSLSSHRFHDDERVQVFVLRAFVLGLSSSMSLGGRKDIHSVKSAWSVLHAEFKVRVLPPQ